MHKTSIKFFAAFAKILHTCNTSTFYLNIILCKKDIIFLFKVAMIKYKEDI